MKNANFALPEPCARLLWARTWAPDGSAIESMLRLRADLLRRAGDSGLRTALFYSAGWLVEWIEGDAAAVDSAWQQARPAAASARLLHRSTGARTLAEPVQLASLHAGELATDVARRLHHLMREHEQGWFAEPWEVWQALSAPCQLGNALPLSALARRDVLALASNDNAAVDLLRLLANACGARVAYQRYAGSDLARGDVGAAYIDARSGGSAITRVQALSRRALAHDANFLGLRNLVRMVVLLDTDGRRAQALLDELRRHLQVLQRRVEIQVVSDGSAAPAVASAFGDLPGVQVSHLQAQPNGGSALAAITRWLAAPPGGDGSTCSRTDDARDNLSTT
ncbi:MAG TPA: hypothetical protein VNB23_16085 [Ramlibacter sp.]|nr:hypothetical protein [Ramlibacter sp.]